MIQFSTTVIDDDDTVKVMKRGVEVLFSLVSLPSMPSPSVSGHPLRSDQWSRKMGEEERRGREEVLSAIATCTVMMMMTCYHLPHFWYLHLPTYWCLLLQFWWWPDDDTFPHDDRCMCSATVVVDVMMMSHPFHLYLLLLLLLLLLENGGRWWYYCDIMMIDDDEADDTLMMMMIYIWYYWPGERPTISNPVFGIDFNWGMIFIIIIDNDWKRGNDNVIPIHPIMISIVMIVVQRGRKEVLKNIMISIILLIWEEWDSVCPSSPDEWWVMMMVVIFTFLHAILFLLPITDATAVGACLPALLSLLTLQIYFFFPCMIEISVVLYSILLMMPSPDINLLMQLRNWWKLWFYLCIYIQIIVLVIIQSEEKYM